MTKANYPETSGGNADRDSERVESRKRGVTQVYLARAERDAALHALAGRLAHQIRNPLAAVRAACSSLRSEVDDSEQRETLDLAMQEIDRMLGYVKATVQMIPEHSEKAQPIDAAAEAADVVDIARSELPEDIPITMRKSGGLRCALPRDGLRVAMYSMLDHLAAVSDVNSIHVEVAREGDRVFIAFAVSGGDSSDSALTTGMISPTGWVQPIGMLVAERFARQFGGHLLRSDTDGTSRTFTLDIPNACV